MRDDPGGEAQVAEDHVLHARAHVGAPVRDALLGLLADQVQDHRDVVRAETPEGVLVGAQLAEVHAVAVDVVELAQLTAVDQLLQARHGGVVLEQVAHHQDPPRPLGRRDGAFGVGDGCREGLLHEAVLARLQHARRRAPRGVGTGVASTTASSSGSPSSSSRSSLARAPGKLLRSFSAPARRRRTASVSSQPGSAAKLRARLGPQ